MCLVVVVQGGEGADAVVPEPRGQDVPRQKVRPGGDCGQREILKTRY